jgi:hypothetical protein
MMFRQFIGGVLRLFLLTVYWFGLWIIAHNYIANGAQYIGRTGQWSTPIPGLQVFLFAVLIIAGLAVSERVIRLRLGINFGQAKIEPRKTAAIEPEALRLRYMISLLGEDDLDDLRAEVREGLRDRIRNLTADESESFEDLLADAGTKRKRGAR